ncbi:hypothetical protein ADICEAN_00548 [Cesiribacter andamanensis AMV16]|uniref:Glycosyltransferase RgtA/B/C/D-like domain-containing protein n=2 Tax=Cesiribacter TaxID=1133570 RepID=M7NAJ8_9BACT|nr:hypothetical protein ADICEAN_00548 [Cesiribacter andamanensis AMV16]
MVGLYSTITEALHPSLVVITLFLFYKALKKMQTGWWMLCGLSAAAMVLTRPLNLFLILAFAVLVLYLLIRRGWSYFSAGLYFSVGLLLLLLPWTVRNYSITGDLIVLEKFYHEDPMIWGKGQNAFRGWWSAWDRPRAELLGFQLIRGAEEETTYAIDAYVASLPAYALQGYSREDVRRGLLALQDCYRFKLEQGIGIRAYGPGETPPLCEEEVKQHFLELTEQFKANAPFRYYVITPLKLYKEFIFHSYSSGYAGLQPSADGYSLLQLLIKTGLYGLNVLLHASIFLFLLFAKGQVQQKILFGTFYVSTALFLCFGLWGVRYVEVRYMLQTYPLLYCTLAWLLWQLYVGMKSYMQRRRRSANQQLSAEAHS